MTKQSLLFVPLLSAAALSLSACYNPTTPPGRACSESGECPEGQSCDELGWVCLPECDEPPCERTVLETSNEINRDLDVLFVVDNSGTMDDEQISLVNNFHRFINVLQGLEGGLPNLHIGVISTDMGAGPYNIPACSGSGDNGQLQGTPQGACTPPNGVYIEDIDPGDGTRQKNYTDTLEATFACIARLGIDGCGFEQTLKSIRTALDGSNPSNNGFLRQQAQLLIVILSDEDDCSADDEMFDPSQMSINDPLGPLSSFRCFEFGVECETGNDDPRAPGERQSCTDAASDYMIEAWEYAELIKSLKPDPDMVWVAGIFGDRSPVNVELNMNGNPQLAPSCTSSGAEAAPGIRLASFVEEFPLRHSISTICSPDLSQGLVDVASLVAGGLGRKCIQIDIDLDPESPGVQADCTAWDVYVDGERDEIEACAAVGGAAPCYNLGSDPGLCPSSPGNITVDVVRDGPPPSGSSFEVRCRVL